MPVDEEVDLEAVRQEALLWVQASGHPNILPIIEADLYDDMIVIASEYAPDGALDGWLKKFNGASPPLEAIVELLSGILAGLEHLHSRRIIHRDLKLSNILLQGDMPRIADFGISRALRTASQSITIAGSPAYMAPEAFSGKRTRQTDIWSVGVIFYQLLTGGRFPFQQSDMASLILAIQTQDPDPLPATVPPSIRQVVDRSLSKNPEDRYESAAQMRNELRSSVALVPIQEHHINGKSQIPIPNLLVVQKDPVETAIPVELPTDHTPENKKLRKPAGIIAKTCVVISGFVGLYSGWLGGKYLGGSADPFVGWRPSNNLGGLFGGILLALAASGILIFLTGSLVRTVRDLGHFDSRILTAIVFGSLPGGALFALLGGLGWGLTAANVGFLIGAVFSGVILNGLLLGRNPSVKTQKGVTILNA